MIAAVKRWHAVLSALLFFFSVSATAADDVGGAARELARKTAAFAGKGAAVAVTWRNISSLESAAAQARSGLRSRPCRKPGCASARSRRQWRRTSPFPKTPRNSCWWKRPSKGDEHQVLDRLLEAQRDGGRAARRRRAGEEASVGAGRADSRRGFSPRRNAGAVAHRASPSTRATAPSGNAQRDASRCRPPSRGRRICAGRLRLKGTGISGAAAGSAMRGSHRASALRWTVTPATMPGCWNRAAGRFCWPISPPRATTSTAA